MTKGDGRQTGTRVEESEWDKIVREAFQRNSILLKSSSFFIKKKLHRTQFCKCGVPPRILLLLLLLLLLLCGNSHIRPLATATSTL